jgi:hypothetical protein
MTGARLRGGVWRVVAFLPLLLAPAAPMAAQTIDTLAIRGHTLFLADDLLLGRGTGTQGEHLAAAYIASQATRLGLQPIPGADSFLLPLPLRAVRVGEGSSLLLRRGADSTIFRHGADFVFNTGGRDAFRDFQGSAVFLGQPSHAGPLLQSTSLNGRVAVFLGPLGAAALDIVPALRRGGAAGAVLLVPEPEQYDFFMRSRGETRFYVDAAVDDPVWQPDIPVLIAGPAIAEALLDGVHVPPALLQGGAQRGVDLDRSLAARLLTSVSDVKAANVAAMLPGSDTRLRHEYIVYTAHLDHLGVGLPDATGDSVYSGFSDNAAGVAMLLAIAEALRERPPLRSMVFLFTTGEERGLLGSSFLAATGALQLDRIAALINLDAGAPPAPPVSWRIAGGEAPLAGVAAEVAARHGWSVTLSAASPNSDHWPFLVRGVPAIFIIPGEQWENTTPEQRLALRERWDRYHMPGDRWHRDFPFAGLGRYADFAMQVGLEIAGSREATGTEP